MGIFEQFKQKKSLAELEEETEQLEAEDKRVGKELSIVQKRQAIAELKARGLQPKHFGDTSSSFTWKKIWHWLKTH